LRLGEKDPYHRDRPFEEPVLADKLLKLAGAMPYSKEEEHLLTKKF